MSKCIRWICIMQVLILPSFITAQEWVARYNGPHNHRDYAQDIVIDNAGNVYVTGSSLTDYGTEMDYATVKYNSQGIEQWVAFYDGPSYWAHDVANAIALDSSGNIYVTGIIEEGWYNLGAYATIKYDSAGVQKWVKWYNSNGEDEARAITIGNMNNIYVTGTSHGIDDDYATVKYDSLGIERWVKRYNGPANGEDDARSIAVDDEGYVYITGWSDGGDSDLDYATVKYDSAGAEHWIARYDGPDSNVDKAYALAVDGTGYIYVAGSSYGSGTELDFATVKYDSDGVELWVARYNGTGNATDTASALAVDDFGNVYVTGSSYGSGTDQDYATVKYDSAGIEQWVARYNGPGDSMDAASAIAVDDFGNVYVTGVSYGSGTDQDYTTVMYDPDGGEIWVARYNGPANGDDLSRAIRIDDEGAVYVTGRSWGNEYDFVTIKYIPDGIEEQCVLRFNNTCIRSTIFRGPLQLPEGKRCKVFDIMGRVVMPEKMKPGVYFIEIDGVVTQKVIKIK